MVADTVKTYCLDTNVLLSDPGCINAFEEHNVIVPMVVLEELDHHKSRADEVGKNARQVSRSLDMMRQGGASLTKGVSLPGGGTLRIASIDEFVLEEMPSELRAPKVDNLIIAFMYQMVNADKANADNMVLVSRDINVRIKCDSLNIKCEDYRNMRVVSDQEKLYKGVVVIEVEEKLVDEFFAKDEVMLPESVTEKVKFHPNQIVIIKHKNEVEGKTKSAIAKYLNKNSPLIPIEKIDSAFGLKPRNKEQTFSLDLLYDEDIKLLTLVGPAGTGKTVIALAAALDQLKTLGSTPRYNKLLVMRTVQPVGKDIGFLPGTLQEKMDPWIAPVRDNLNFLMENKRPKKRGNESGHDRHRGRQQRDEGTYLSLMQENGLIEIEAITYIRGRSIPNAFIIIDEAQNLSVHELKTLITRVGEGTKIVLTGDIQQIDNVHVDAYTNGLTYAVERFKDHAVAGHVTLLKGERSPLATLASQIL